MASPNKSFLGNVSLGILIHFLKQQFIATAGVPVIRVPFVLVCAHCARTDGQTAQRAWHASVSGMWTEEKGLSHAL